MEQKNKLFIGIDLNNSRAMVSLFYDGMAEPETVSTIPGEEHFRIPTAVYCSEQGHYYYGDEAVKRRESQEGSYFSDLYREALNEDNVVYRNMLVMFLRRLLHFADRFDEYELEPYLAIAVPEIDDDVVNLFDEVRDELEFSSESFRLMEYGESVFAYVYNQEASVFTHDVAVFEYEEEKVSFFLIHADMPGEIKRVTALQNSWDFPGYLEGDAAAMDEFFSDIIREAFEKNIISGVYLVGDGFDGGWLNTSLHVIGPNKRVFKGKNLYTVGTCFAAYRCLFTEGWNYYFDCHYKLQGEISIQVMDGGEKKYIRLAQLGENWFSPTEKYYFLYDGNPTIETWTRFRQRMNARKDSFTLEFMPEREPRSIRLSIQAFPLSGREVMLQVMDDGFGELFESSGKLWEFPIVL